MPETKRDAARRHAAALRQIFQEKHPAAMKRIEWIEQNIDILLSGDEGREEAPPPPLPPNT